MNCVVFTENQVASKESGRFYWYQDALSDLQCHPPLDGLRKLQNPRHSLVKLTYLPDNSTLEQSETYHLYIS